MKVELKTLISPPPFEPQMLVIQIETQHEMDIVKTLVSQSITVPGYLEAAGALKGVTQHELWLFMSQIYRELP